MRQTKKDRKHIWYLYTLHIEKERDKVNDRLRAQGRGLLRSTGRRRSTGWSCTRRWATRA